MNSPTLRNSPASVKGKKQFSSHKTPKETQLVPVLLRRGENEMFYYLPTCGICSQPILDFEQANVVVLDADSAPWDSLESLGTVEGAEMFRLPGVAIAVHFECDKDGFKPWVRSSSVFCRDQRSPVEKLTGLRVGR